MKFLENVDDNVLVSFVQISRRLVRKDYRRVIYQSPRNADALLLSARQLMRKMLCTLL